MGEPTAFESNQWDIRTRIAGSPDDFAMVMAVRACAFLAEEDNITYADEFGTNDHVGTHILALVNGDPAGVIRIRWFGEFAMLERIGVRRRYRSFRVFKALGRAAMDLIAQKGYRIVVGRARGETKKLWARLVNAVPSGPDFEIERGILTPMITKVPPAPDALAGLAFGDTIVEHVICQDEGQWDFEVLRSARARVA